jgi:hypothetical protein
LLVCGALGGSACSRPASLPGRAPETASPFVRAALANDRFRWYTSESAHFRLHAPEDSYAFAQLDLLATVAETARGFVLAQLAERDSTESPVIDLLFVENDDEMHALVGQRAGGWTYPAANAVVAVVEESGGPALRHELAHLYSHRFWGSPATGWISEGVAMYAVGHCAGLRLHQWAAALAASRKLVSLRSLEHHFDFSQAAPHLEAGSFVTFVRDRYGMTALRALWTGGLPGAEQATGVSAVALEAGWREELRRYTSRATGMVDRRTAVQCE